MNEQRWLFEPRRAPWVDRLWQQVGAEVRRQVVTCLAEMARAKLGPKEQEKNRAHEKERSAGHES